MKELKTITEYELLHMAFNEIKNKYMKELEFDEKFKEEHGDYSRCSFALQKMYVEQMTELNERIQEMNS